MIERTPLSFDFGNAFISISLNISNIEAKEDSNTNDSENFNINIQTYLTFKKEYKEFIVIRVNLNIVKNDGEEYLYNEDNLYFESNNAGYNSIIQINYIYNYYAFHLGPKATYNFFPKAIFRPIKKVYREKETKYQILITRTTIYKTFISSSEHPPIYIRKRGTLKRY